MDALNFTQLQRVDNETDIAIAREPNTVMLVMNLVAETHAIFFHAPVTAHVKNRGRGFFDALGHIKIAGDIQTRLRLKMNFPNLKLRVLQFSGDRRFERCTRRHGIEPQHLVHLPAICFLSGIPVFNCFDFGK